MALFPLQEYQNRQRPQWTEAHSQEICTTPILFQYKRTISQLTVLSENAVSGRYSSTLESLIGLLQTLVLLVALELKLVE